VSALKTIINLAIIFLLLSSCEKSIEFTDEGYFDGIINGHVIKSELRWDNKYFPGSKFVIDKICEDQGKARIKLLFVFGPKPFERNINTIFLLDSFESIKGKNYNFFNEGKSFLTNCDNVPEVSSSRKGSISEDNVNQYSYVSDNNNYLKIEKVKEGHIIGNFKIKYIRKQFLEEGIESFDKHLLPDSLFIECKKFIAVNED
jgi:hypothetical protein